MTDGHIDTNGVHGPAADKVVAADVKEAGTLLTLDEVRTQLEATEPLSALKFPLRGTSTEVASFDLKSGWCEKAKDPLDVIDGTVRIGDAEYQITKDAVLEAGSLVGITRQHAVKTPADLIQADINWHFSNQDRELKALHRDGVVLGFTKASITPFSNLTLLDRALEGIAKVYGDGEVLADYKSSHDLRKTVVRLIVPEDRRAIAEDDEWSSGVQFTNSLIGAASTSLEGYLFRWWCTNGATTMNLTSGAWNRRRGGQGDDVYDWARLAVEEILGGLEHEFEKVESLRHEVVDLAKLDATVVDVFQTYSIPVEARPQIIEDLATRESVTMYDVMQAVTRAANAAGLSESVRAALMAAGGTIPTAHEARCEQCHRLPV